MFPPEIRSSVSFFGVGFFVFRPRLPCRATECFCLRCGEGLPFHYNTDLWELQPFSAGRGAGVGAKRGGRREGERTPHPPLRGPPSPAGEGEKERRLGLLTEGWRERVRTPHPPLRGPPSPTGEGKGAERRLREDGRCYPPSEVGAGSSSFGRRSLFSTTRSVPVGNFPMVIQVTGAPPYVVL